MPQAIDDTASMTKELIDRSSFPCLIDHAYLNQASLGLIGDEAVQAMHRFLDDVARHGNLRMSDDDEVDFIESMRQTGASILNCDCDELAIFSSASELLGQIPFMIRPEAGSNVVAVSTDFPAVTRPWIRYERENDCVVRFVDDVSNDNITDRLIGCLDDRTAVVAVSAVQFSTGSKIDIPRLRDAASAVNARVIVDVTQSAGAERIDSTQWDVDGIVTSGYKWLGGHGGIALASLSSAFVEQIPPLPGWMGASSPFDFDATRLPMAIGARRYTQSTMSYVSMAGLATAIDRLLAVGEIRIAAHASRLCGQLINGSAKFGWVPFRSIGDPSASAHIVALSHPKVDARRMVDQLRQRRVICGERNGRIRISLAPYNNSDDIDALIDGLGDV